MISLLILLSYAFILVFCRLISFEVIIMVYAAVK